MLQQLLAVVFAPLNTWARTAHANEVIRRKPVIKRIRHEFALLGFDLSDFSDEDIKQGVLNMAEVFHSAGVTTDEAVKALTDLLLPAS